MSIRSGAAGPITCVSRFLEPIFPKFLEIQYGYLTQLEQAIADGDHATLRRLGHSMKGGAATYQLPKAAVLAERLELAAMQRDIGTAARVAGLLRRYYASLAVEFVDKAVESPAGTD